MTLKNPGVDTNHTNDMFWIQIFTERRQVCIPREGKVISSDHDTEFEPFLHTFPVQ